MHVRVLLRVGGIRARLALMVLRHPSYRRDIVKRLMDSTQIPPTTATSTPAAPATETNGQATVPAIDQKTEGGEQRHPVRVFVFVRHGQTTWNVEGRLPGQLPDVPLTEEGRQQAHRAAVALSGLPLSAVISSPLERARDTADIIARGWALPVRLDARLMDTEVGAWAGHKIADVAKNDPAWKAFVEHPTEPPPGVESLGDVQARAVAVVEDARRDPELGNYVIMVAHADVVKLILAHYTDIPLDGVRFISIANASISALAFAGDTHPHLLTMNWTPSPGWLVPPLPKPKGQDQAKEQAQQQKPETRASENGRAAAEPAEPVQPADKSAKQSVTEARDTVSTVE